MPCKTIVFCFCSQKEQKVFILLIVYIKYTVFHTTFVYFFREDTTQNTNVTMVSILTIADLDCEPTAEELSKAVDEMAH